MRGERGEVWRLLVCTSSSVSICMCVSVLQDFDAMTEEEQMAFAIQMSLGKQQGVCIFRICLSYTSYCMCMCMCISSSIVIIYCV